MNSIEDVLSKIIFYVRNILPDSSSRDHLVQLLLLRIAIIIVRICKFI